MVGDAERFRRLRNAPTRPRAALATVNKAVAAAMIVAVTTLFVKALTVAVGAVP
jgi:hypothetical protein